MAEAAVNTNVQQCKILMFVADQDVPKDNFLNNGAEYLLWLPFCRIQPNHEPKPRCGAIPDGLCQLPHSVGLDAFQF